MKKIMTITMIAALPALVACTYTNGYEDANGNWIEPGAVSAQPSPSYVQSDTVAHDSNGGVTRTTSITTYAPYDRPGVYDSSGSYTQPIDVPDIPQYMYPAHGLCRVWFRHRLDIEQPAVESCDGIRERVPAGAYVIYGG